MSTDPPIALSPATPEDGDFLLGLRNDPGVADQSFSGPVDPAAHGDWLTRTLQDPHVALFVATERGLLVGTGRLDARRITERKDWEAEIAVAVRPEARGRGVGTAIILGLVEEAARRWPGVHLLARIKEGNHGSRTAFSKAGFAIEEWSEGVVIMGRTA